MTRVSRCFGDRPAGTQSYVTSSTTFLELSLRATPSSVREARNAAGEVVAGFTASNRLVDDVRLCVSEAVTNVVRHAYGTKRGSVDVVVEREDDELVVVVRDEGMGLTASGRRGKPGGFGLKIIDKVASRHTIESAPSTGTEVRMSFPLGTQASSSSTAQ